MPACTSATAKKCPATQLLQAISGKWKAIILYRFTQQAQWHFGELNASIPPCSTRMLARQLAALCTDGLIQKEVLSQEPLTTVYRLTARGETVKPVIEGMAEWIKFLVQQSRSSTLFYFLFT